MWLSSGLIGAISPYCWQLVDVEGGNLVDVATPIKSDPTMHPSQGTKGNTLIR